MPRMSKLSRHKTTWEQHGNSGSVTYVATRIVSWDDKNVTLDSGNWRTATIKRKMVQTANQFGLGFIVHQVKGQWFVRRLVRSPTGYVNAALEHGAVDVSYIDGITFPRGCVTWLKAERKSQ